MAVEHFNGIYLITPFIRYDLTVELSKYIQVKTTALEELQKSLFNKKILERRKNIMTQTTEFKPRLSKNR